MRSSPAEPFPRITVALIVVCVLVLFLEALASGIPFNLALIQPSDVVFEALGANSVALTVTDGQWWRLLTAVLMHVGVTHLGFNALNLWVIGKQIESRLGWYAVLATFVVTGLFSSFFSLAINSREITSVGASGAVFGLLGFLIVFGVVDLKQFFDQIRRNAIVLALVLAPGFIIPGVDNVAHIGGLLAGLLLGFFWEPFPEVVKTGLGVSSALALLAALGMIVVQAISLLSPRVLMMY